MTVCYCGEQELASLGATKTVGNVCHSVAECYDMRHACPDCGMSGEKRGHFECMSPSDVQDARDSSLEDPMMTER